MGGQIFLACARWSLPIFAVRSPLAPFLDREDGPGPDVVGVSRQISWLPPHLFRPELFDERVVSALDTPQTAMATDIAALHVVGPGKSYAPLEGGAEGAAKVSELQSRLAALSRGMLAFAVLRRPARGKWCARGNCQN